MISSVKTNESAQVDRLCLSYYSIRSVETECGEQPGLEPALATFQFSDSSNITIYRAMKYGTV